MRPSLMLIPLLTLFACGDKDGDDTHTDDTSVADDTAQEALSIIGVYADPWGIFHDITAETWSQGTLLNEWTIFHFAAWDNEARWAVAQNDANNAWYPELWSRFDWMQADGALYYCQTAFDAPSQGDAENAAPANVEDLAGGCGGFPWTALAPPLEIRGFYVDEFDGGHSIDEATWVAGSLTFHVAAYVNDEHWLVARNDEANAWAPGLWSRFDWAWDGGTLVYCQTAYEAETREDAEATTPPDGGNLSAGCNGFPWTHLNPA